MREERKTLWLHHTCSKPLSLSISATILCSRPSIRTVSCLAPSSLSVVTGWRLSEAAAGFLFHIESGIAISSDRVLCIGMRRGSRFRQLPKVLLHVSGSRLARAPNSVAFHVLLLLLYL